MITMIRDEVLLHGWMTEEELLRMVAVSESTPGPIAVNIATFVGASESGVLGAMAATLGIVLPSFIIILVIAALIKNLLKYGPVQGFLQGLRPTVVGLILATAVMLLAGTLLGFGKLGDPLAVDGRGFLILGLLFLIAPFYKMLFKKAPSPILMILISAGLGMIFYSF